MSLLTIDGVVTKIYENEVKTKFGLKKSYRVALDTSDRVSCGFKKPDFREGDAVSFAVKDDEYKTMVSYAVKSSAPAAAPVAGSASAPAARAVGKPFPIPPLHGDRSIVRQNALTNARSMFEAIPATTSMEAVMDVAELIINVARRFEAYSCGDIDAAEAAASDE